MEQVTGFDEAVKCICLIYCCLHGYFQEMLRTPKRQSNLTHAIALPNLLDGVRGLEHVVDPFLIFVNLVLLTHNLLIAFVFLLKACL